MKIEKYINNKIITKNSEKVMDTSGYKIRPSKHFILTWMRKWNYDIYALRDVLENAYKVDKVGKSKYETYTRAKEKSRKLIFIKDEEYKEIFIITGAEGK